MGAPWPVGPIWAPCWPHEPCCQGRSSHMPWSTLWNYHYSATSAHGLAEYEAHFFVFISVIQFVLMALQMPLRIMRQIIIEIVRETGYLFHNVKLCQWSVPSVFSVASVRHLAIIWTNTSLFSFVSHRTKFGKIWIKIISSAFENAIWTKYVISFIPQFIERTDTSPYLYSMIRQIRLWY